MQNGCTKVAWNLRIFLKNHWYFLLQCWIDKFELVTYGYELLFDAVILILPNPHTVREPKGTCAKKHVHIDTNNTMSTHMHSNFNFTYIILGGLIKSIATVEAYLLLWVQTSLQTSLVGFSLMPFFRCLIQHIDILYIRNNIEYEIF